MAATVLNGSGNLTYTNNTGENVRAIIYYMSSVAGGGGQIISITSSFGTSSITSSTNAFAIGRDAASAVFSLSSASISIQNIGGESIAGSVTGAVPTQIMLADGQSLSATCGGYNIVIIPENG